LEVRSKEDLYITRATNIIKQIQKLYLKGNGCHKVQEHPWQLNFYSHKQI